MRIAISGASGRMGQALIHTILKSPHTLAACLVHKQSPCKGRLVREIVTSENIPHSLRFLESPENDFDVLIDFSTPQNMQKIATFPCPLVIGTTGLLEDDWRHIHNHSHKYPIIYSPNFSIGINLFFHIMPTIMTMLPDDVSIDLTEVHRKEKRDLPGGTAKHFQKIIPQIKNLISLRQNEHCGSHTLTLHLKNETIEFVHKAKNRLGYAQGALMAAEKSICLPPALYDTSMILENPAPLSK